MNPDQDELRAWLRLLMTPRVGPGTARRLLAALGSPQAVFDASPATRAAVVGERDARGLRDEPEGLLEALESTLAWARTPDPAGAQRALITLADPRYPAVLLEAPDPPLLLFAQGRLALLGRPAVAVVGSRSPTPQGQDNARTFSRTLSEAGLTVISGLADGVDGAAHEGALEATAALGSEAAGSTIAVVGTGLDRVYPRKHHALAHRIAQDGLILGEFLLGTPPLAANFPKRNRVVAGMSRGTLVVEAAVQSGSLITARLASEMGREVFAIPGSIHAPQARGCHALIKQGAKLVETAQDILDELRWGGTTAAGGSGAATSAQPSTSAALAQAQSGDAVLDAMGFDPVSQEALSARTGLAPAALGARLLELELLGQVARLPGALYQRVGQA